MVGILFEAWFESSLLKSMLIRVENWIHQHRDESEGESKGKKDASVSMHSKPERVIWVSVEQVSFGSDLLLHVLESQPEQLSLFGRHPVKSSLVLFLGQEAFELLSFLSELLLFRFAKLA